MRYPWQLFAALAADALHGRQDPDPAENFPWHGEPILMATGILMERYGLDEERAMSLLLRPSLWGHVVLGATARAFVNHQGHRAGSRSSVAFIVGAAAAGPGQRCAACRA
jgi:hypothetical protein